MKITDYICEEVLRPRLKTSEIVVVYDGDGRYRELSLGMADEDVLVIDAAESVLEAREKATEAVIKRGLQPEKHPQVLVYVPSPPPPDEDGRCEDFFSGLAESGDCFPKGDSDSYLEMCLRAKPDFGTRIKELFAGGDPSFEAVDAVGDSGGRYPTLQTELACESSAEILVTLLVPGEGQETLLKNGGVCRKEALTFLDGTLGFKPKKTNASWNIIQEELWRLVLFSEFAFDLPEGLPESLSTVPLASEEAVDLVNRVCGLMRDKGSTRPRYIEESERVARELDLEKEMADVRDLGVRDTFSFEERSFLSGYIDALRVDDYSGAETIAEGRRGSVWVQESDRQLLWTLAERALDLLRSLADFNRELDDIKQDTGELISFYTGRGYRLDQRYRYFEETLTEIDEESEDLDQLVADCREKYRTSVDRLQRIFINSVQKSGWPLNPIGGAGTLFDSHVKPLLTDKDAKVAVIWVDALRYELAVALNESLSANRKTDLDTVCGAIPSITPVGMASLLPGAAADLSLRDKGGKLVPHFGDEPVKDSQARVSRLAGDYGDRFLDITLDDLIKRGVNKKVEKRFEGKALALVRYQRIDLDGEKHAPDLFLNIKRHTDNLLKAVGRLADLGYGDIFLFTDHGYLVFPEKLPGNKATKPDGTWCLAKDRVLAGKGSDNADTVRFAASDLGVKGDAEDIVFPKSLATFTEGVLYFHGGLSVQECVLPVLHVRAEKEAKSKVPTWELRLSYRGKSTGTITTRRPMIEIAAFSGDMFKQDITFNLVAAAEGDTVVGKAASSACTDKNTGYVTIQTGQTAKVPLKLDEDFNGSLTVRAQDPDTGKYLGNAVKLETRILE